MTASGETRIRSAESDALLSLESSAHGSQKKKKKNNFTSFYQPTRLITCAIMDHGAKLGLGHIPCYVSAHSLTTYKPQD